MKHLLLNTLQEHHQQQTPLLLLSEGYQAFLKLEPKFPDLTKEEHGRMVEQVKEAWKNHTSEITKSNSRYTSQYLLHQILTKFNGSGTSSMISAKELQGRLLQAPHEKTIWIPKMEDMITDHAKQAWIYASEKWEIRSKVPLNL